jgi:hypothetical protein
VAAAADEAAAQFGEDASASRCRRDGAGFASLSIKLDNPEVST